MNQHHHRNEKDLQGLVFEYEAMSQKGAVGFFEEAVFVRLIQHYESDENIKQALEVTDHAIAQHGFCPDFYMKKAQLLLKADRPEEALDTLQRAEIYAPAELEIQLLRAEALVCMERVAAAFTILEVAKSGATQQDLSQIYFCEALIFEGMEDFHQMFVTLCKSVMADPTNRQALERVWLSVEMSQSYQESAAFHEELIDIDPYSYIAWYNLGHACFCLKQYTKAADAFEYAFLIKEDFEFAYRDCAEACIKSGDYHRALKCYAEALDFIDADTDILTRIGYCQEQLNEIDLAKNYYREALQLDDFNDLAYFRMGECYLREKSWENAIGYYRKAIAVDEYREEYYAALASAYHQIDMEEKALLFFRKAVDTAPETSQYWVLFATFLLDIGANEEALEVLEEALMNAGGPELLYGKIACMILLKRKKEALYLLHQALDISFDQYESMFDLVPGLEEDQEVMTLIASFQAS